MGIGIVEPFDEFDLARQDPKNLPKGWDLQPSHPELLNELAAYFRENNYSLHKLFTLICNSSAYQLSARFPGEWNENYTKYYARKYVRMLTAEELHDAMATATERPGRFLSRPATKNRHVPMAMQVSVPARPVSSRASCRLSVNRIAALRPKRLRLLLCSRSC